MTPKQTAKYWRMWGRLRTALVNLGEFSKADADAERHAIHREALGCEKSSKDLTNRDLDKIFDAFDRVLVILDGPHQIDREARQPAARLIWAIDQLGLDEPYIQAIARDEFQTPDWRSLSEPQLTRFRYTLTRAARRRSQKS